MLFNMLFPVYAVEGKSIMHDGAQRYIKLGRLRVVKEEGGKRFEDSR